MPTREQFWDQVDSTVPCCWPWTGAKSRGYGVFSYATPKGRRTIQAHRFAYEDKIGPIPDGLQLDHTCHQPAECPGGPTCPHRACCRPDHLEPVTNLENQRRGLRANATHCIHEHPFDAANTYVKPGGGRQCKTCRRATDRRRRPSTG